jgi:hypothetical protein
MTFEDALTQAGLGPLRRAAPSWLQINLGKRCNQTCAHCHVDAGPHRREQMSDEVLDDVLRALSQNPSLTLLDITGGAPELHPRFRDLVRGARALGRRVMDRCNLTVLLEPGQEDTASFLAAEQVEIVASMPCYLRDNVERQRGRGVYDASVEALRRLNALGYGQPGSGLVLSLVYNPGGAFLPPSQDGLRGRLSPPFARRSRPRVHQPAHDHEPAHRPLRRRSVSPRQSHTVPDALGGQLQRRHGAGADVSPSRERLMGRRSCTTVTLTRCCTCPRPAPGAMCGSWGTSQASPTRRSPSAATASGVRLGRGRAAAGRWPKGRLA